MRKKYHELSLAKKFSLTSIGFFFSHNPCINCIDSVFYTKNQY